MQSSTFRRPSLSSSSPWLKSSRSWGHWPAPPKLTDPASGEITRTYTPAKGPSFIDIGLHEGDLAVVRGSATYKNNAVSLPEFGKDAFVNPNTHDFAVLFAKKGNLIVDVSLPTGPAAVDTAKTIARKALVRL